MTANVAFIGAAGYETTPEDVRNLVGAIWPNEGALTNDSFLCTPSDPGAGFALNRTAGKAVIPGEDASSQGNYFVWDDGDEDIPWEAPDGTFNRIDSLLLLVVDSQYGTPDLPQGPHFVVAVGTPASVPVALSDAEIIADYAQPGAWRRVADIQINVGDLAINPARITMRLSQVDTNRVIKIVESGSVTWPADGSLVQAALGSAATPVTIGGGSGLQQTTRLRTTLTVRPGRLYEVSLDLECVDRDSSGANPAGGATITFRYTAAGGTLDGTATRFAQRRIGLHELSGNSLNESGVFMRAFLPRNITGDYLVGAFITNNDTGTGVRIIGYTNLTIRDAGPQITEGGF